MSDIYTTISNCNTREEKKEVLKQLSQKAKALIQLKDLDKNVNAVLIDMYTNETHNEFNTFKNWISKGYKVKKGEKGFFIWSKKLKGTEKKENEDDKDFKFFGIAYIFSNAQVQPIKQNK
ncbi:ArdC-like ssDNA-binding domain-containing protein [Tenacibaculum soleae]|uniref:ArdC-like ssDNA-binding domain-containing protein n=1 Tax=Tenacibaculum soleae TaxID=447689 RepID=UPI002301B7F5|nr:ArdC-like ssDNA-binding domain-containing protein [Tenacibaculum soleae]